MLVAAVVTEANVQDRAAFPKLLRQAKRVAPTIAHVWLDKGYTGTTSPRQPPKPASASTSCPVPKPDGGFGVQPRRWVVKPANGWINDCR